MRSLNSRLFPPLPSERQGNSSRNLTTGPASAPNAGSNTLAKSNAGATASLALNSPNPASSAATIPAATTAAIAPTRYVRFGSFHLDLKTEELFRDGSRVKLQGKVYQALLALLERPGEIVTREALRMKLWPADTQVNYDANVNTTVNKLRQVLGGSPEGPNYVDTIPRKGYSFVAKVEYTDEPAPRPLRSLHEVATQPAGAGAAEQVAFLGPSAASKWFTVGVICLIIAGMLFGAAVMMFVRRAL